MSDAYTLLTQAHLWGAFVTMYSSIMGPWFYVMLVFITDLAVGLKTKSLLLTLVANLLVSGLFYTALPTQFISTIIVINAGLIAVVFYRSFIKNNTASMM